MTEILIRVMNIVQRVRNMQDLNMFAYAVFGILLIFGIMNCLLGYRLLRFWVMLFGFCIGALGGAFCMYYVEASDMMYYLGAMIIGGLVVGIIGFLSYRIGIFILGAGTGLLLSLYILHPTTSFAFFVCILVGIGLGVLGLKFCREVIIVVTSLAGGVLTGVSAAKLLGLAEFPYGILISSAAAGIGLLIQFAMNHPEEEEEDEEEIEQRRREAKRKQEEEDYFDELAYEEMQREAEEERRMRRKKVPQIDLTTEEAAALEMQKPVRHKKTVQPDSVEKLTESQKQTKAKRATQVDFTVGEPVGGMEESKSVKKKKATQVEKSVSEEQTRVKREKTAQMELTAEEAAWIEEQRQLKQRRAVVQSVQAEASVTEESEMAKTQKISRRAKKAKRMDAVVDVRVGE